MSDREELQKLRRLKELESRVIDPVRDTIQERVETVSRTPLERLGRAADDTVRSLASGATFGFADELAAAGSTALGQGSFEENLRREEAKDDQISPLVRIPGEVAGGVASTIATGGLGLLRGGATLPRLAATGAVEGGIAGAGFARGGAEERAKGAALGAGIGAAAGPVSGLLARGGRRIIGALARGKPRTQALKRVAEALERDALTPERAQTRLARFGDQGVVADIGENTQRLGRAVTASPGPAATRAANVLKQRSALGSIPRIRQVVRSTLSEADFNQTLDDVITTRARVAAPLYDEALSAGQLQNEAVSTLLEDSRHIRQAINRAKAFPEFANLPDNDIRILDQAYKNLGDLANRARISGNRKLSRDLNNLRVQFRDSITDEVPAYGKALDAFSDESNLLDALQDGRRFIREDADVTSALLKQLPESEREMFLIGATREIMSRVNSSQNPGTAIRRLIGNADIREKIAALFTDRSAFNQFRRALIRESRFATTRNVTLGGSPTQRITGDVSDLAGGPVTDALQGDFGRAALGTLNRLATRQPSPAVSRELGQMLFSTDQALNDRLFQDISRRRLAEALRRPGAGLTGAVAVGAPAISNSLLNRRQQQ